MGKTPRSLSGVRRTRHHPSRQGGLGTHRSEGPAEATPALLLQDVREHLHLRA
jgi:hypothetical protein